MIESVLDGTHARSDRWEVIAAGSVTAIEPLNDDYGSFGAWVRMDVAYWFRGGDDEPTLTFFDPPAGGSGVGFAVGNHYLVLATHEPSWGDRLATGLCELTHLIPDLSRMQELASRFGAVMPDTALPAPRGVPWDVAGSFLVALAVATVTRHHAAARRRAAA